MGDTPVLILFSPWLTLICQVVKFVKHNLRLRFSTLLKIVCFNPSTLRGFFFISKPKTLKNLCHMVQNGLDGSLVMLTSGTIWKKL